MRVECTGHAIIGLGLYVVEPAKGRSLISVRQRRQEELFVHVC